MKSSTPQAQIDRETVVRDGAYVSCARSRAGLPAQLGHGSLARDVTGRRRVRRRHRVIVLIPEAAREVRCARRVDRLIRPQDPLGLSGLRGRAASPLLSDGSASVLRET